MKPVSSDSVSKSHSVLVTEHAKNGNPKVVAVFTLVKLGIGAGIVCLPGTFKKTGLALGIPAIIAIGYCAYLSANIIIEAKIRTGESTYEEISRKLLGKGGFWLISTMFWFLLFLLTCAYMILVKEFMTPLINVVDVKDGPFDLFRKKILFNVIVTLCIVALTGFFLTLRDLSFLRFTNMLGVFSVTCLCILSLVASSMYSNEKHLAKYQIGPDCDKTIDLITAFGPFMTAFFIHVSLTHTADLLPDQREFYGVTKAAFSIMALIYFAIGVGITILLGDKLEKDIFLENFERSGVPAWLIAIGSLLQALAVCCSIPLIHFFWREVSWSLACEIGGWSSDEGMSNRFFFGHIAFWLIAAAVAMSGLELFFMISFIGNLTGSVLMMIVPPLIFLELEGGIRYFLSFGRCAKSDIKWPAEIQEGNFSRYFRLAMSALMLVFGVMQAVLSFYTLYDGIDKLVHPKK